jgi:hydroxyacylglutathione hydrolase
LTVIGGVGDSVDGATRECTTGDVVQLAPHFASEIFLCPCHTKGHILFRVAGKLLFTGDTLFAGGCGRFFEGDAAQMYANLHGTIAPMSDDTIVFPGHEYTVENLSFCAFIEPANEITAAKLAWARGRREGDTKRPTIPTTLKEEKEYNVFMRTHHPSVVAKVQAAIGTKSAEALEGAPLAISIMDGLRNLKNSNAHKK